MLLPLEFTQKVQRHWHRMAIGAVCGSENLCFHMMEKLLCVLIKALNSNLSSALVLMYNHTKVQQKET